MVGLKSKFMLSRGCIGMPRLCSITAGGMLMVEKATNRTGYGVWSLSGLLSNLIDIRPMHVAVAVT